LDPERPYRALHRSNPDPNRFATVAPFAKPISPTFHLTAEGPAAAGDDLWHGFTFTGAWCCLYVQRDAAQGGRSSMRRWSRVMRWWGGIKRPGLRRNGHAQFALATIPGILVIPGAPLVARGRKRYPPPQDRTRKATPRAQRLGPRPFTPSRLKSSFRKKERAKAAGRALRHSRVTLSCISVRHRVPSTGDGGRFKLRRSMADASAPGSSGSSASGRFW